MRRALFSDKSQFFLVFLSSLLMLLAIPAQAGKPGSGDSITTTHSGRAIPVAIDISGAVNAYIAVNDTNELPANGGMLSTGIETSLNTSLVDVNAKVLSGSVVGSGEKTVAASDIVDLNVNVLSGLLRVKLGVLNADAKSVCARKGAKLSGSANIFNLEINGIPIDVSGYPNQKVEIDGIASVTINEQIMDKNVMTTNAIHITVLDGKAPLHLLDLLGKLVNVDVVISHARAGIVCGNTFECPVDGWVTGGGQYISAGGEKISFGLVGGEKPNGLSGHVNSVNHSTGEHLRSGDILSYSYNEATGENDLKFANCNGSGSTCYVRVVDNGEPGTADESGINTSGFSSIQILHGNLQLHQPQQCKYGAADSGSGGGKGGGGKGKNR